MIDFYLIKIYVDNKRHLIFVARGKYTNNQQKQKANTKKRTDDRHKEFILFYNKYYISF